MDFRNFMINSYGIIQREILVLFFKKEQCYDLYGRYQKRTIIIKEYVTSLNDFVKT